MAASPSIDLSSYRDQHFKVSLHISYTIFNTFSYIENIKIRVLCSKYIVDKIGNINH